jgi:hypothetical protein
VPSAASKAADRAARFSLRIDGLRRIVNGISPCETIEHKALQARVAAFLQ